MRRKLMSAVLALASLTAGVPAATAMAGAEEWSIARFWDEETLYAIRLSTPRPPIHARNLYHVSAAMYDAWAAYDPIAHGRFFFEKHTAEDVEAARHEAISYAAYRILKNRFVAGNGPNIATIQAHFDASFASLGYDNNNTNSVGDSPSAIGNRIAEIIIAAGLADNSNQTGNYAPNNGYVPKNPNMPFKIPGAVVTHPNNWQPLAFDFQVLQNGEVLGGSIQAVICPHWAAVTPFALNNFDRNPQTTLFNDVGPAPLFDTETTRADAVDMIEKSSKLDPAFPETIDISPGVYHNSPLGSYEHLGHGLNPVTNEPYEPHVVKLGDYVRTLAEFWADGPTSETPPGHWHSIANKMSDNPLCEHRLLGQGPVLDRLEWDVKMYLALGGANHDAAVVSWGMKGYYDSARPITFIRNMAQLGQSSDPKLPNYHPQGIPLVPGLIEIITEEDVAPGGRFQDFPHPIYEPNTGVAIDTQDYVGKVAIRTWMGGFVGGVTGVATVGPLPGHVYRDGSGWHMGGFEVGANDTPGVLNSGLRRLRNIMISEIRVDQHGDEVDEWVELSGPAGASLDGLTYVVVGDEVQSSSLKNGVVSPGVPDAQGRIQVIIDLTGHTIGRNGTFVIAKPSFTLGRADLTADFTFREIGNHTHMLVSGFFGTIGEDLDTDSVEDNVIDFEPWTSVLDSIALRRKGGTGQGIYSTTVLGPDSSKNQTYGVGWVPATYWQPYQSSAFVTPPFPGFTSGHSTYSRSAAEVLTVLTGSPYFPGGFAEETLPAGWSNFEIAPSEDVSLQWASYYDCADEAGVSRIWGGIHPRADDLPGRISGSKTGLRAVGRALALFQGLWQSPDINYDGVVDGADLGILLGNWDGSGVGDLNGDGLVDGADLGLLLGNWTL